MNYIGSNIVPIVAATLGGLLIGLGYRALSIREDQDGRPSALALSIVAIAAEFWLAAILAGALILAPVQANPWTIAIVTAVVIWIGFVVPALALSYVARRLSLGAILLDCVHWLAVMVAQAAILNAVGLVRP